MPDTVGAPPVLTRECPSPDAGTGAADVTRTRWRTALRHPGTAPFTYGYLLVLLATTIVLRHVSARVADRLLAGSSTDVAHLAHDPVRVLLSSALWLPGRVWAPYALMLFVVLAPLERRLGSGWAVAIFLSGHLTATLLTEVPVAIAVAAHWLPNSAAHRLDVGVSYGTYTAAAACAGLLPRRWRLAAVGAAATAVVIPLLLDADLTTAGHLLSVLIGVCWWVFLKRRGVFGTGQLRRIFRLETRSQR